MTRFLVSACILAVASISCQKNHPDKCSSFKEKFRIELDNLLLSRDTLFRALSLHDEGALDRQNEKIMRMVKQAGDDGTLSGCDLNDLVDDVSSIDDRLRFVGWDTEAGGTMAVYRSVTFVDGAVDTSHSHNFSANYNEIVEEIVEAQTPGGEVMYLIWGFGKVNSAHATYSLRAISLTGGLNELRIFPGDSLSFDAEFWLPDDDVKLQALDEGLTIVVDGIKSGKKFRKELRYSEGKYREVKNENL